MAKAKKVQAKALLNDHIEGRGNRRLLPNSNETPNIKELNKRESKILEMQ